MKLIRSFTLLIIVCAIAFVGAMTVFPPTTVSAATCCTYGADCAGDYECYFPSSGQADCSADNPNYCRPPSDTL